MPDQLDSHESNSTLMHALFSPPKQKTILRVLLIVVAVFIFCMWDKTLVGFLIVVPLFFLLIAIPIVVGYRVRQLGKAIQSQRKTNDS